MHDTSGALVFGGAIGFIAAAAMVPGRVPQPAAREAAPIAAQVSPSESGDTVRLGVYDSRGVAIAWARSEHNDMRKELDAHRLAEETGDTQTAEALEAWGIMKQRELHFQGFGIHPVDRYVGEVLGELPDLMAERDLDAIVWMSHAQRDRVELVDVTVDLMVLLGMDREAARRTADQMRTVEPLDFATLYGMDPMD
jgi:hypothetical protein